MKIQIIEKCADCKFHQFDPDYLTPTFYGKDCCMWWYWNGHQKSEDHPKIVRNSNQIPEWCPLEDIHTVNGIPVDELDQHKINCM